MGIFNPPKAADPTQVANTQQQYNQQAANANLKLKAQTGNKTGPFGSTTVQTDANGMPIGQTVSLDPSLNSGGVASAFGGQVNNLGTGQFDWDSTTAGNIAQGNYNAYAAMTAPQRKQQQNALKTTLAERGLPLGSEIEQNEQGNLDRQFANADINAAAQAWNAVPGMQAQLQTNQVQQQLAPGQVANQSLGLIGGLNGLSSGYADLTPQGINPADFQGAQANYDKQNQQNYANMWSGIGNLGGVLGGALFSPNLGTNFGNTLAGQGAKKIGGLFGGNWA